VPQSIESNIVLVPLDIGTLRMNAHPLLADLSADSVF
jgi:hypothetical protein